MELKVLEERPNPLLKRTEYRFEITHATAATPSREEVRAELSKQLRVPKDRLVVERMHARYGTPSSRGEAMAYHDAKVVTTIVRSHILIRNKLKEKEGAAPAPTADSDTPSAPPAASKEEPKAAEADAPKEEKPAKPRAKETPAPEPKSEPKAAEEKGKPAPKSSGKTAKAAPDAKKE
ncbi:MAG: 30S ribosomal protein S24e [Thermoplasmata archaeon]